MRTLVATELFTYQTLTGNSILPHLIYEIFSKFLNLPHTISVLVLIYEEFWNSTASI